MIATDLTKPQILVIEDNVLIADAICDLVRDCGCEVAGSVAYVQQGVQFLAERPVDGAVVDIKLHDSLSFPICDELRRRSVPFFFLTGHMLQTKIPSQFQTEKFLSKPVDAVAFRKALTEIQLRPPAERESVAGALSQRRGNALLAALAQEELQGLAPKLERVDLREGQILEAAGQPVPYVHFLTDGLVALMARSLTRRSIDLALLGAEGATGLTALLAGTGKSVVDAVVHIEGAAWRMLAHDFGTILRTRLSVREQILGYVHSLVGQIAETTLSTGHAKIEQRVGRWLLMAADRCGTHKLAVTHDRLSRSLAVRRSGITVALHMMESRGLIRTHRRLIEIRDRSGLMQEVDAFTAAAVDSVGLPASLKVQEVLTTG